MAVRDIGHLGTGANCRQGKNGNLRRWRIRVSGAGRGQVARRWEGMCFTASGGVISERWCDCCSNDGGFYQPYGKRLYRPCGNGLIGQDGTV